MECIKMCGNLRDVLNFEITVNYGAHLLKITLGCFCVLKHSVKISTNCPVSFV